MFLRIRQILVKFSVLMKKRKLFRKLYQNFWLSIFIKKVLFQQAVFQGNLLNIYTFLFRFWIFFLKGRSACDFFSFKIYVSFYCRLSLLLHFFSEVIYSLYILAVLYSERVDSTRATLHVSTKISSYQLCFAGTRRDCIKFYNLLLNLL